MVSMEEKFRHLEQENARLNARLIELEDTLAAIRSGEVDAVVVAGPRGDQIFSLQGTDHTYRVLIEEMQEGAITLDVSDGILFANKFIETMLGRPMEKILGRNVSNFVDPSDLDAFSAALRLGQENHATVEVKLAGAERRKIPAFVSINQINLGDLPLKCLAITDLSEQKRHERILAEEQLSRSIIQQSADTIIVCDATGQVIRASRSAFDIAGQNCLEQSFDAFFHIQVVPENKPGEPQVGRETFHIQDIIRGAVFHSRRAVVNSPAAEGRHYLLSAAPLVDDDNLTIGCILNLADITDRLDLELNLREAVRAANVGLWEVDLTARQVTHSPELLAITGLADDQIGSDYQSWLELIHPEDRASLQAGLSRARQQGAPGFRAEFRLLNGSGSYCWVHVQSTFIRGTEGTATKLIGSLIDITSAKNEAAEKARMERELAHARRMQSLGTLAGGIAHDFNNILSGIIGFSELALEDVGADTKTHAHLQKVYDGGLRARDLVKHILTFARQTEEQREPIRVDLIAKEVLKFIRASIPASVEINGAIHSRSLVLGNPTELHQVFMNLCANAAQAMEETGGLLAVTLQDVQIGGGEGLSIPGLAEGYHLEITVSDTGIGIPPENIDVIFEPYFTTKGPKQGTGLGLAMVHGIVESHGGRILVESEVGKGSEFRIFLPITRQEKSSHSPQPVEGARGKERILLVDDEPSIVEMECLILERLGYTLTTASSSTDALKLFEDDPDGFDLVITDMTMPVMTGDKLASRLHSLRPDLPIILVTGYSDKITPERAAKMGFRGFGFKPFTRAALANLVTEALHGPGMSS